MMGREDSGMEEIVEFFECDECSNRDFERVYNFSLRFHKVNFSDDLIYDKLVEEIYLCTNCQKRFTKQEIEEGLDKIKKKYRKG